MCAKIERDAERRDKLDDLIADLLREKGDFEKAASAWIEESRSQLLSPRNSSRFSSTAF